MSKKKKNNKKSVEKDIKASVSKENAVKENNKVEDKKQETRHSKVKKCSKSFIGKVLEHKKDTKIPLLVFQLLLAFILDTLKIVKNLIVTLFIICIVIGVVGGIMGLSMIKPYYDEYNKFATDAVNSSTYETFQIDQSTFIYDNNDKLLVKLKGNKDSEYLKYEDIPADIINAFIAVEDRSFWDNPGIDIKGLIRVGVDFIKTKGDEMHGASTITQQLARNIFLTHEVSLERKAKEMLIALKLTEKYSKQDIMEFYVNDICFANAYYGIQSASKGYFNKEVDQLNLSEIAYLCAIPNAPEYYNPYKYPERAVERRDKILGDMLGEGMISEDAYTEAKNHKIVIDKPTYEFNDYQSTYAIECAVKYFMKEQGFKFRYKFDSMDDYKSYNKDYSIAYGRAKDSLYTGGYKIYTTLDSKKQAEMQYIIDNQLSFSDDINEASGIFELQGAMTVIDNSNGKVIAIVGGRSQENETNVHSFNRAYQALRQPGSTIKPIAVYLPALENGYTPDSTVYNISVDAAKRPGTDVQALRGSSMTLRRALEQSKNGVAWQLFDKFGADECLSYLNKMQFASLCPDDYYNSSSLGGLTYGTTTVEMASAYATIENHGIFREPTCISRILDNDNNNIYNEYESSKIYSAKAADTVTDIMTGVLTRGTAYKLGWKNATKMAAAAKTGTTNESKDGWLCGFTPYYTISVWVGYDTPRAMEDLYGSTYPGQIWKDAMLKLVEDKETITEFEKADYKALGEEVVFEISDELPAYAYEKYMPGRSDNEVLAENYTVYNYRKDRVIGESVDKIISEMESLDKSSGTFLEDLKALYNKGCVIVDAIYGRTFTAEKQAQLYNKYSELKGN